MEKYSVHDCYILHQFYNQSMLADDFSILFMRLSCWSLSTQYDQHATMKTSVLKQNIQNIFFFVLWILFGPTIIQESLKMNKGELKILPDKVRSFLRSGIAITSVIQCVEELVYNAIDANATCIAVRINLETNRIQVVDNGFGLNKADLSIVGTRYATSKCHSVDNLNNLQHHGYRGEALASIIKLSETVEIKSRGMNSLDSFTQTFQYGKMIGVCESFLKRPSHGTTVTVTKLFYNLPVRRNAKDIPLEREIIKERLEAISVINPSASFSLRCDEFSKNCILQTRKCSSTMKLFLQLWPDFDEENIQQIEYDIDEFSFSGLYVSESHHNDRLQFIYVNKRIVVKSKIQRCVNFFIGKYFSEDNFVKNSPTKGSKRYPVYCISISCPLSAYDITFDPRKSLVEFCDWRLVIGYLFQALQDVMLQSRPDMRLKIDSAVREYMKTLSENFYVEKPSVCANDTWDDRFESSPECIKENVKRLVNNKASDLKNIRTSLPAKRQRAESPMLNSLPVSIKEGDYNSKETKSSSPFTDSSPSRSPGGGDSSCSLESPFPSSSNFVSPFKRKRSSPAPGDHTLKIKNLERSSDVAQPKINKGTIRDSLIHKSKSFDNGVNIQHYKPEVNCLSRESPFFKFTDNESLNLFDENDYLFFNNEPRTPVPKNFVKFPISKYQSSREFQKPNPENGNEEQFRYRQKYPRSKSYDEGRPLKRIEPNFNKKGYSQESTGRKKSTIDDHFKNRDILTSDSFLGFPNDTFIMSNVSSCQNYPKDVVSQNRIAPTLDFCKNIKRSKSTEPFNCYKDFPIQNLEIEHKQSMQRDLLPDEDLRISYRKDNHHNTTLRKENENDILSKNVQNNDKPEHFSFYKNFSIQEQGRQIKQVSNKLLSTSKVHNLQQGLKFDDQYNKETTNEMNTLNKRQIIGRVRFSDIERHYDLTSDQNDFDSPDDFSTKFIVSSDSSASVASQGFPTIDLESSVFSQGFEMRSLEKNFLPTSTVLISNDCPSKSKGIRKDGIESQGFEIHSQIVKDSKPPSASSDSDLFSNISTILSTSSVIDDACRTPENFPEKLDLEAQILTAKSNIDGTIQCVEITKKLEEQTENLPGNSEDLFNSFEYEGYDEADFGNSQKDTGASVVKDILENWSNPVFKVDQADSNFLGVPSKPSKISVKFSKEMLKHVSVIGQIQSQFIGCLLKTNCCGENSDPHLLAFVDQHALHERIRLERFIKDQYDTDGKDKTIQGFKVQPPVEVQLKRDEVRIIDGFKGKLKKFGVEYTLSGKDDSIKMCSLPSCLVEKGVTDLLISKKATMFLREVVSSFRNSNFSCNILPKTLMDILATKACTGAIKFGDSLDKAECENLLGEASECALPFQCAHGRPSFIPALTICSVNETSSQDREISFSSNLKRRMDVKKYLK